MQAPCKHASKPCKQANPKLIITIPPPFEEASDGHGRNLLRPPQVPPPVQGRCREVRQLHVDAALYGSRRREARGDNARRKKRGVNFFQDRFLPRRDLPLREAMGGHRQGGRPLRILRRDPPPPRKEVPCRRGRRPPPSKMGSKSTRPSSTP